MTNKKLDTKESLTITRSKNHMFFSEYGFITYQGWCLNEVERIGNPERKYRESGTLCWID